MIREITLGQYYPSASAIHKMDPRFKIIATFSYIISLFIVANLAAYLPVVLFLALVIAVSKVPLSYVLRGLKPIFLIIIFTVSINLFFTPGEAIFRWGFISLTRQGISQAIFLALRLILLIMGTSMMTFTTSPIELTDGLESLLNPLKKIGFPAHEIAMMMTIALRFIPTLLEETDKIMKAQMARGTDFESGSLIARAKNLVPILVPLFISAFHRADELAMAMEARCYRGGEGRVRMKELKYRRLDLIGLVVLIVYFVTIFLVGRYAL
ncbi:MAG: transporter [Clostridiales bacterium]|nr:MAG: transporter [Clostridiales bacterium]